MLIIYAFSRSENSLKKMENKRDEKNLALLCGREDLNLQALRHSHLKTARLPFRHVRIFTS